MKLYEIDQQIMQCMDDDTGEVVDFERLEALSMERDKKLENIALYIKGLTAEAAAIKEEEKSLAERRKSKENKAESLKSFLAYSLGGSPLETPRVRMSFQKSTSVDISEPESLLEYLESNGMTDCIKYTAPEISKKEVGKALKAGQELPGCCITENKNLQIK